MVLFMYKGGSFVFLGPYLCLLPPFVLLYIICQINIVNGFVIGTLLNHAAASPP